MNNLAPLLEDIWKCLSHETPGFVMSDAVHRQISKVDIRELLIAFFRSHGSSWNEDFLLATFDHWKYLTRADWDYVFREVEGNRLGEYYMGTLASRYLGIDPKYASLQGYESASISVIDGTMETGSPAVFVGDSKGGHLEFRMRSIRRYGLSLQDFIAQRDRLVAE